MKQLPRAILALALTLYFGFAHASGGPDKGFLEAPAGSMSPNGPVPVGTSVGTVLKGMEGGSKTWTKVNDDQWLLTFKKNDVVTGKKVNMRLLFVWERSVTPHFVIVSRINLNGYEAKPHEVLYLMNQMASAGAAGQ